MERGGKTNTKNGIERNRVLNGTENVPNGVETIALTLMSAVTGESD